jgi:hypothetical protein
MNKAAADQWGAKAPAIVKAVKADKQKCCLVDGDLKEYDGYADNWAVTATRKQATAGR